MRFFCFLFLALALLSCTAQSNKPVERGPYLIEKGSDEMRSSTAGNLMATALRKVHDLDIVFYPKGLLPENAFSVFFEEMSAEEKADLINYYPVGVADQFRVGTMKGKNVRRFLEQRLKEKYVAELEVAGIQYDYRYLGGVLQLANLTGPRNTEFDDEKIYQVAISNSFYFSDISFPGYKYRNSMGFVLKQFQGTLSAREALKNYLEGDFEIPALDFPRANVSRIQRESAGYQPIHRIQGNGHMSPFVGRSVVTQGIVTAVGLAPWYPHGFDVYIQSLEPDDLAETSEAVHLYLDDHFKADFQGQKVLLKIGDIVRVTGSVYEHMSNDDVGVTSLREVSEVRVVSRGNTLPKPIELSRSDLGPGRKLPSEHISTYIGNVNHKPFLKLSDGLDFFESVEGMRVQIRNPRVTGFRGGKSDHESFLQKAVKPYLTLYVLPDGDRAHGLHTQQQGIMIDEPKGDFNPEIITIETNHLATPFDTEQVFNVGDLLNCSPVAANSLCSPEDNDVVVTGVMSYHKNIFGGGQYALIPVDFDWKFVNRVIPGGSSLQASSGPKELTKKITPMTERPKTKLVPTQDAVTIATYNVENLSGAEINRIKVVGQNIADNLKCPDIVNLVEIQDNNGIDQEGGSAADITFKRLQTAIPCGFKYAYMNIDPVANNEGGQPGGNIRVAMMYNPERIDFQYRPIPGPLAETFIKPDGNLNYNPGRIDTNSEEFAGTRRSIVAQFGFKGHQFFVIGNHFNSKLGDTSHWSAQQPVTFKSEEERVQLASRINRFVRKINRYSPKSGVVVAGDFNAFISETSMQVLEGRELFNVMNLRFLKDDKWHDLVPANERYTTNHNGNSQPLDYIFIDKQFRKCEPEAEVLHINSNYMGRVADHDPVIVRLNCDW